MRGTDHPFARLTLIILALFGVVAAGSAVANKQTKLAKLLAERDPGKLVGGNTIVGTGKSEGLFGVPDRPNFVMALGDGETIHGAAEGDQIGARGKHVKLIAPAAGHALIEGGPQGTIVVGGKGHDLVYENRAGATIKVTSPGDEIVAKGRHDRVICGRKVHDEIIRLGKSDTVSAGCRGHHDTINHSSTSHSSRAPAHATQFVTGSGTNADPYTAPCDTPSDNNEYCGVSTFPPLTLPGLWYSHDVPAYRCPNSHPFLRNVKYMATGIIPNGVEVLGLGPVGVSITRTLIEPLPATTAYSIGTKTKEGNEPVSPATATNWTTGPASYEIVLHCTKSRANSY